MAQRGVCKEQGAVGSQKAKELAASQGQVPCWPDCDQANQPPPQQQQCAPMQLAAAGTGIWLGGCDQVMPARGRYVPTAAHHTQSRSTVSNAANAQHGQARHQPTASCQRAMVHAASPLQGGLVAAGASCIGTVQHLSRLCRCPAHPRL